MSTLLQCALRRAGALAARFVMNQTMLRVRDPAISTVFYRDVLGMTLLDRFDFEALGVGFVKRPDDGKMKGLAFIKDPDG